MRKLIKEEIMMKNDLFKTLDRETQEKLLQQGRMEGRIEGEINKAKNIAIELLKLNLNINDNYNTDAHIHANANTNNESNSHGKYTTD